ncbi:hypothetical protein [Kaistella faecalis]|uniref:EF-Tu C-terminal domain-related protein n=1 Tax=Kaistella faecalis TaxID=2852098 RepID=UPI001C47DAE5|nr:hypothetical protein [Chryseobacterium faecale]UFK97754.1 hypothetical protein LL667_00010 [Chryseobacterium faecale]
MDREITTFRTLENIVDFENENVEIKQLAELFLTAMNDWDSNNQTNIFEYITKLRKFVGSPITLKKIEVKSKTNILNNACKIESTTSIAEMIKNAEQKIQENDFDKIITQILNYYNSKFEEIDFLAELQYLTTENGGRNSYALSGYRPQVKFPFSEMTTSGQQIFINKEYVFPGDNVEAKIKILSPELFQNMLYENLDFEMREGAKIVAIGKITKIINENLQKTCS